MIYRGMKASGDLSASQFMAVRLTGDESFDIGAITNGNAQIPIGILQNAPNADGKPAEVAGPGEQCKAELGGTVDEGNFLAPTNDGSLINAPWETSPATADLYLIAMALEAGVDGDIIQVVVQTPCKVSTE